MAATCDDAVVVTVSDTGIGIPTDELLISSRSSGKLREA